MFKVIFTVFLLLLVFGGVGIMWFKDLSFIFINLNMILNKLEHFVVNKLKKVGFDKNKRGIIRIGLKTMPHSNSL